jgi:hypothetical protein
MGVGEIEQQQRGEKKDMWRRAWRFTATVLHVGIAGAKAWWWRRLRLLAPGNCKSSWRTAIAEK